MINIKELSKRKELFTGGHRLCAGCGAAIMARQVMLAASKYPVVVVNATGCLEVASTIFPYTAWQTSWFHSAFENAAATASGIEAAYKSLKNKGKIKKDMRFVVFAGDGGAYDIGFQSLSGAMERGHRILFVCYNNDGYMNTGIQRSSATPAGARTATSPVGLSSAGKVQFRKDLTAALIAHNLKYVAQTIVGNWSDLVKKVETALENDGPSFINIYSHCHLGWGYPPKDLLNITKLAIDTCFWPLYEVIEGKYNINYLPKNKKPLKMFLEKQARFKHLNKPENKWLLKELQKKVDNDWQHLLKLAKLTQN